MPDTVSLRCRIGGFTFNVPVARMVVGAPTSRLLDGRATAAVSVEVKTFNRRVMCMARVVRILRFLRIPVDVEAPK